MTQSTICTALKVQFCQALAMLRSAIETFPADAWERGDRPSTVPARLAYHGIETADFYSREASEGFVCGTLGADWEAMDAKPPTADQLVEYSKQVEGRLSLWLGSQADGDLAESEEGFPWFPNQVTRALYSLRHLQQTVGELNQLLKMEGQSPAEWR